jgi:hypothetical protein
MDGFQGRPLASAKRELLASLNDLGSVHQFQIIFYNERPSVVTPLPGSPPRMLFGSDSDKRAAIDFVKGIRAHGGTAHFEALKMALRLHPDVIFFLTDAEEPRLSASELRDIKRMNDGIGASIYAIEFGSGPALGDDNFLKRIAGQNGGQHTYVDVSRLPGAK